MKIILLAFLSLIASLGYSQSKTAYLEENRSDLNSPNFDFPQKDFNIIGFGAYHGSAKTETTEQALLESLTKDGTIKYYLPETDFSIAHFFNEYLRTGDSLLLKDLVYNYGARVPQEQSVETYKKWKELKKLNDGLEQKNRLGVVGIDLIVTYKYTAKHLLEIMDYEGSKKKSLQSIVHMVKLDTTDFSPNYNSYSKKILREFVEDYKGQPEVYENIITDQFVFDHIIENLEHTFQNFDDSSKRERIMYQNYLQLGSLYNFEENKQFLRFGFFHIEKQREGKNASFFTMLIENGVYARENVISVIGYLTKSRVLWDVIYDENGDYKTYTTEGGFGIGDYEKEYFLGIENLKKTKISDITLFRLNKESTPYNDGVPDLMEIVMQDNKSNGAQVKGKSTVEFLDYAILISNSKESIPIQEMK